MTDDRNLPLSAEELDDERVYSIDDLGNVCQVTPAWIVELIEHGIIEAQGDAAQWRFSSVSVVRVAKAKRFDRELGVNPAGIALAFDLLNEIERLKAELSRRG
jgi:chaperone modulatory protein CbpM